MARKPRVLIAVRLTVETDSTTSPERQLKECTAYCERRGWELVGVAKDLSVSATAVPPWKRPELSSWLEDRAPEFDNILFWRLDRFVRRVDDLHAMIEWAKEHGKKGLVSATEPFDLTDPSGEAMAIMIAAFAHMEARAASERVASMRQHLLPTERWGGGSPPYGYRTYDRGDGRYLEVNPETAEVVREATRRIIGEPGRRGESVNSICRDFEERGIPAPASTYKKNKSGKNFHWYPRTLKGILTSPTLLGFKTRSERVTGKTYGKRVLVHDAQGHRILMADPILSKEEWESLQKALIDTAAPVGLRSDTPRTPFLNVIKCGSCGKNLQLHTTKKKRKDGTYRVTDRIRCMSRVGSPACPGYVFLPHEEIIEPLMQALLKEVGDKPVTRRVYVEGDGSAEKLDEIEDSINYHVAQLMPGGIYSRGLLREKGEKALASLQEEYERLNALGDSGQDHWEYLSLGVTFAQRWTGREIAAITDDLVQAGITLKCNPPGKGGHTLDVPDDLRERFTKVRT
ncbi:recombinase family protein [Streptomyces sp. NBC_01262]|uniref:recombinase family protein n=1 Tax=Streptomyces sp. NBC_01262 TaxID=2903803 RepID=UPI002E328C80|nr:recombinase family protein [Streptomyces sp. NBC_01262]